MRVENLLLWASNDNTRNQINSETVVAKAKNWIKEIREDREELEITPKDLQENPITSRN